MTIRRTIERLTVTGLAVGLGLAATLVAPMTAQAATDKLTLRMNSGVDTQFAAGETVWLRGTARRTSGEPVAKRKVVVYRLSGSTRKTVATATTNADGHYVTSINPTAGATYVAVLNKWTSRELALSRVASRTLEQRERSVRFLLGSPTAGVVERDGLRWRTYGSGVLVQTSQSTWLVRKTILTEYRARKGPTGPLGAPTEDAVCGLVEAACLQHFATGAIYANSNARDKVVSQVAKNRILAAYVAVAQSQRGYVEPSYRHSKYSRWLGRTGAKDAWCGYFTAWLSHAAGDGDAIVRRGSFSAQVRAEKARKRTTSAPGVGRLAYSDYFRDGRTTHVGIVLRYDARYVWTIEGNVDAKGRSGMPRGVHLVKRARSQIVFYAVPRT